MTLSRRLMAIIAGHLQAVLDIVAPPPGEGPTPPPAPEPGPGTAPTVKTLAATGVTTTAATLNGELLSLGSVDSETPRTTVNVWFQYRVVGAGTWTETTPVEQVAVGAFSAGITGLTPDTAHEFRAAVTSEAGSVFGNLLAFTSDGVTDPEQPGDNFLDLTASAVQSFDATAGGDLSGPAGTWASSSGGFRQPGPPSMIVDDLVPSIGMRSSWKTTPSAAWMNEVEFTWLFVLQQHGSQAGIWHNLAARDDGITTADRWSAAILNDGAASWRPRKAGQSAVFVNTPPGQVVLGDIAVIFMGVGPSGAFVRVGMNAEVVDNTITSLGPTAAPLELGAWGGGQAPFYGAWGSGRFFDARLTTGQMDAIVGQVKARILFAPPLTFTGVVGDTPTADPLSRALMASASPTTAISMQPALGTAEFIEDFPNLIRVGLEAAGTDGTGSYTLTDPNGMATGIITLIVTADPTPPTAVETKVGEGGSTVIDSTTSSRVATWANGYTPQAGDRITIIAGHRSSTVAAALVGAYPAVIYERADLQISSVRRGLDMFDFVANGTEGASITVEWDAPTAGAVAMVAHRLSAGWVYEDIVATAQGSAANKTSLSINVPAGDAFSLVAAFIGRPNQPEPDPTNMRIEDALLAKTIVASNPEQTLRLRGAIGQATVPGGSMPLITNWE